MNQTGLTTDQLTQLAKSKGLTSASIAQMLSKKRSFDRLMSLDFKSMQSIDNLANLIQKSMTSQSSLAHMKNWDWNNNGLSAPTDMRDAQGGFEAGLSSMLSLAQGHQAGMNAPQGLGIQANATFNPSSFLQNLPQLQQQIEFPQQGLSQLSQLQSLANANAGGQTQRLGNLLQGMGAASNGGNPFQSLLQSVQNDNSNFHFGKLFLA